MENEYDPTVIKDRMKKKTSFKLVHLSDKKKPYIKNTHTRAHSKEKKTRNKQQNDWILHYIIDL